MLKEEENRLITQVGPGTPMGDLLREHWLPGFLSSEIQADGDPLRLRLLGEDLSRSGTPMERWASSACTARTAVRICSWAQ